MKDMSHTGGHREKRTAYAQRACPGSCHVNTEESNASLNVFALDASKKRRPCQLLIHTLADAFLRL